MCTLMVLGRSIEASYMTASYLGELVWWNEIEEIKYECDFPVEYTWIPHVPVWDRAGGASRAPSLSESRPTQSAGVRLLPTSGPSGVA